MPHILPEFRAVAAKLQADFQRSAAIAHNLSKGETREEIITDFLRDHLPQRYSIGSGIIADKASRVSRQQDIVIYDGFNTPVLQDFGATRVFFAEQVLAAIEVKSRLTAKEISDLVNKAQSIRQLERTSIFRIPTNEAMIQGVFSSNIFVFGVAYESDFSVEDARDRIQEYVDSFSSDWGISAMLILSDKSGNAGVLTNADPLNVGTILLDSNSQFPIGHLAFVSVEDALFHFYLLLLHALQINTNRAMAPDYIGYAQSDGMGGPSLTIGEVGGKRTYFTKVANIVTKTAHQVSDEELLDAITWMVLTFEKQIPGTYTDRRSRYGIGVGEVEKDLQIIDDVFPWQTWNAINNRVKGIATEEDQNHLAGLMELHRKVARDGLGLTCGYFG